MPRESLIRDWLANHLEFLEPGLKLLKKEQYLPNLSGSSGFIDLFAQDSAGRVVVIEIKRAEAAARQAITELANYAALLKISRGLRKSEIRFIVISTVWEQLRAPFSEWSQSTDYLSTGFEILADETGRLLTKKQVLPIAVDHSRKLCRRQLVLYYKDNHACDVAEKAIESMSYSRGIKDFLIFRFELHEENHYEATRGLLYVQQLETKEFYLNHLRRSLTPEEYEEALEYAEDHDDPDDKLDELAEHLPTFDDVPRETLEICGPEKTFERLAKNVWSPISVARFGRFASDERLTDDQLWFEVSGSAGSSFTHFIGFARSDDRAKIAEISEAIKTTLYNNSRWRHAIDDLLRYSQTFENSSLTLVIFDNASILDNLLILSEGSASSMPVFSLLIDKETSAEAFFGEVRWDGTPAPDLKALVEEIFQGNFFDGYLFARHFGGQREKNEELMSKLGLVYCVDSANRDATGTHTQYEIEVRGIQIRGRGASSLKSIEEFSKSEGKFLRRLKAQFDKYVIR